MTNFDSRTGKPKINLSSLASFSMTESRLKTNHVHTICESGLCPNKRECWGRGTATFMILGNNCTRNCSFCGVSTGKPKTPDYSEIESIAQLVRQMQLKHVVLTSVTRDDLPDYGATFWADSIQRIKNLNPNITMETLIPDFKANESLLDIIIKAKPEIVSHNLETIERLTPLVRSVASYEQSLSVLRYVSSKNVCSKTGIMLGLGEEVAEVQKTIVDIRKTGCKILTIGQYYSPSKRKFPVKEMVEIDVFLELKLFAQAQGFLHVESGPLVRSSYHAELHV